MTDEYDRLANREAEAEHGRLAAHHRDRDAQERRALAGEEPDAILTASEAEVDAELRRLGVDPGSLRAEGEAWVRLCKETVRLRAQLSELAEHSRRVVKLLDNRTTPVASLADLRAALAKVPT